jgi:hypothetical protein
MGELLNIKGNRQSAIGNRQSAIGNRQSAIGNRQSAIGNRQSAIGSNFWRRKVINNPNVREPFTIHEFTYYLSCMLKNNYTANNHYGATHFILRKEHIAIYR